MLLAVPLAVVTVFAALGLAAAVLTLFASDLLWDRLTGRPAVVHCPDCGAPPGECRCAAEC
jgi:hypothetical protein